MNTLLLFALTNAAFALALYLTILSIKPLVKNPAILHWLWLIVLIKLLTPPIWTPQWRMLPATSEVAAMSAPENRPALERVLKESSETPRDNTPIHQTSTPPTGAVTERIDEPTEVAPIASVSPRPAHSAKELSPKPATSSPPSWTQLLSYFSQNPLVSFIAMWGLGTCSLWSLAFWRIIRLERGLRLANSAPPEVQNMANELATAIGLRRAPPVLLAPGSLSPMLWAFGAPARIVVPQAFFEGLDDRSQRSLLLHELAHYKRGDHYVRFLELAAMGLYWWFPVAWLVRREIRRAEELACDAEVIAQLPGERRAYAEMLVHTLSFVSTHSSPALASGIAAPGQIEERLRNIMRSTIDLRVSGGVKILLTLTALGVLPLAPVLVRAQRAVTTGPQEAKESKEAADGQKLDWLRGTGDTLEIRIRGEVVDAEGKAAEDVKIIARGEAESLLEELKVERKGNQFHFWAPVGKLAWSRYFRIECQSADGSTFAAKLISPSDLRKVAIDGVVLSLRPFDRFVEVKVVEKDIPVGNAQVLVRAHPRGDVLATTDKDGIARFGMFRSDHLSSFTAWTKDHRIGGYGFSRQPTRDQTADQHTIELSRCRPQKIRFINDADKSPVSGIGFRLQVATPDPFYNFIGLIDESTMKTDSRGEAVFEWFPDWPAHHFYTDQIDKEWVRMGDEADSIDSDGAILVRVKKSKLAERKRVTGRVTSKFGSAGGFSIEIRSFQGETEQTSDGCRVITDEHGEFVADVLPGATYSLCVEGQELTSDFIHLVMFDEKTQTPGSPHLEIVQGVPVEVLVTAGPNKTPLDGVFISYLTEYDFSWMENGKSRHGTTHRQVFARTDSKGFVKCYVLPGRETKAQIHQNDWGLDKIFVAKAGETTKIELHRPIAGRRKIAGQLTLPSDLDATLEDAKVVMSALDGFSRDQNELNVDSQGKFAFETSAATFGIFAYTKDDKAALSLIVNTNDVDDLLSMPLRATTEFQGQILDGEGKARASYPVRAALSIGEFARGEAKYGWTTFHAREFSEKTDSQGNYTLRGLPYESAIWLEAGAKGSNDEHSLGRIYLKEGEKRPREIAKLTSGATKTLPLKDRYLTTLRDAKLGGWRTLVVTYQGTPENREFVTQRFYNYDENHDVAGFMHVFHRTTGDSATPEDQAFAESMKWPAPGEGKVFACAMDDAGKELGRIELDIKDADAPEKAVKFLHEFAPNPEDAKKKWDEAFALAAKTDRKVWVRVSQRFCGPCHVLNRWLDDQKKLIEKDYVLLKVDNVRDLGGKEIAARFWDWQSGHGVPFHAIFDASGSKIIDSAGPLGNIGAPSGYEGGKHLKKMFEATRTKLTDEEIEKLMKSLPE